MDDVFEDCTVLHVDADGFFASVEQALDPDLRGRPVVTGAERGIIAASSYEAKALGIKRGLQLREAVELCPELVVRPSDYEAYSLYSRRIYNVLRRFSPHVEEYSIDEAFVDLRGCGRMHGCALEEVAARIRRAVRSELGLTVSVGVSLSKTLSKICSKYRKPDGQTILRREDVPGMLSETVVEDIWGVGPASAAKLRVRGVATARDFTLMDGADVLKLLHKPGLATWLELHGRRVYKLELETKSEYDSMMKGHTFSPPSRDGDFIFAEALRNMTAAFAKLRRHRHLAREMGLRLRYKDYDGVAASACLPALTSHDLEGISILRSLFDELYRSGRVYRSSMVWLGGLVPADGRQLDLFEDRPERLSRFELDKAVDGINKLYGQGSVAPAAMLALRSKPPHVRDAAPERYGRPLPGEGSHRLAIPRLTLGNPV